MSPIAGIAKWLVRAVAVVSLVFLGTTILVRFAPGYFSDIREMDSRYAGTARAELAQEALQNKSFDQLLSREIAAWTRGNAGVSRQFGVPVLDLIRPCIAVTGKLLIRSLVLGWTLALAASLWVIRARRAESVWQIPSSLLLAIPTAAMATLCLFLNWGGAVTVMALLLAARDFKFVYRTLRKARTEPWFLQARAQGLRFHRVILAHVLPATINELAALAGLSLVTALSALIPVEVIFDVPGLGKLAWNAALNRDLPVLVAVTLIMAIAVTVSGYTPGERADLERA